MFKQKSQVVTVTCTLHQDIENRLRTIEKRMARIEGTNYIIIAMLAIILPLVIARL